MRSYRFARRAFLASVGGAVGLKILLRNLEVAAEGAQSPPRFLMMHWPVGTVRYRFLPTGAGKDLAFSPILKPFETAGLKDDLTILYGLSHSTLQSNGGGGHEAGTPMSTTGAHCPGTRENGGEADDAVAGGPSWDQILLKHVPDLQRPGTGYANAICDARVDSFETSTQCLSYGHTKKSIVSASQGAMQITENVPLLPTLSPVQLYLNLFSGFMPGGSTPANQERLQRALRARKSVLDYSLGELDEIRRLAPASEGPKVELHAEAVRALEQNISELLASGMIPDPSCAVPEPPDPDLVGESGSGLDYANPQASTADDVEHEAVGKLHASIIKAAFQCDLIRVATFQWSPGTNHVTFKGLHPDDPEAIYMHHPMSHRVVNSAYYFDELPFDAEAAGVVEFLAAVHTWYNQKIADIIVDFKNAKDVFESSLLDHTIVPCVTEVAAPSHERSPLPALILGGKALGMQGGQYLNFESDPRHHNDLWLTVAQAYLQTAEPLSMLSDEVFDKGGVSPIEGLWLPPA